jgi:glycosyltransferase involved in cell wall biosynthesis
VAGLATVLIVSFSDLGSDPRVDRQIAALRTRHRVTAAAIGPPSYDGVEFVDITTAPLGLLRGGVGIARLITRRFEVAYWRHPKNLAVYRRLQTVPADLVLANDLPSLPISLALGPPVVFDAHEYAPDEFADRLWWRTLIAPYAGWLCRRYIPEVAAMTTVAEGIAEAYERLVGVRAVVVRNTPPFADLEPTPVGEQVRILHHGAAIRGRGLEEMVRLADLLDERFSIDFVLVEGSPGYRDALIRRAGHNPRVRFPPPVPMREIVPMANSYDIGLYLLAPSNLNQRYALPNKFFEYIQGRLAVAIGPSPEMARIVDQYGCGLVAPDFTAESLATMLNRLDSNQIAALKQASHSAAADLCAQREAEPYLTVVEAALGSAGGAPTAQSGVSGLH